MFRLIPRWIKVPFYGMVRRLVGLRVNHLPLSGRQGEWWARTVKSLPVIFHGESFARDCVLSHGIQMRLGITDHIERHLRTEGEWDPRVSGVLRAVLQPGMTFLDVGANIGYFSLLASKLVGPDGLVVSIEPSIRALRKFTAHIHRNGCGNVLLLSVGAGETCLRQRLTLATEDNIGGSAILPEPTGTAAESIAVVPLDQLLRPLNVIPNLIKMDIEGFELHALRGLLRTLEATPPIVCEVTDAFLRRNGQSAAELLGFMNALGYDSYRLHFQNGNVLGQHLSSECEMPGEDQFDALFVHSTHTVPVPVMPMTQEQLSS